MMEPFKFNFLFLDKSKKVKNRSFILIDLIAFLSSAHHFTPTTPGHSSVN